MRLSNVLGVTDNTWKMDETGDSIGVAAMHGLWESMTHFYQPL